MIKKNNKQTVTRDLKKRKFESVASLCHNQKHTSTDVENFKDFNEVGLVYAPESLSDQMDIVFQDKVKEKKEMFQKDFSDFNFSFDKSNKVISLRKPIRDSAQENKIHFPCETSQSCEKKTVPTETVSSNDDFQNNDHLFDNIEDVCKNQLENLPKEKDLFDQLDLYFRERDDYDSFLNVLKHLNFDKGVKIGGLHFMTAYLIQEVLFSQKNQNVEKYITMIKSTDDKIFEHINSKNHYFLDYLFLRTYDMISKGKLDKIPDFIGILSTSAHEIGMVFDGFIQQFYSGNFKHAYLNKLMHDFDLELKKEWTQKFGSFFDSFLMNPIPNRDCIDFLQGESIEIDFTNTHDSYPNIVFQRIKNVLEWLMKNGNYWISKINHNHFEIMRNTFSEYRLISTIKKYYVKGKMTILMQNMEDMLIHILIHSSGLDLKKIFCFIVKYFNEFYVGEDHYEKKNFMWDLVKHFLKQYDKDCKNEKTQNENLKTLSLWIIEYLFNMKDTYFAFHLRKKKFVFEWIKKESQKDKKVENVLNQKVLNFSKKEIKCSTQKQKSLVYLCFLIQNKTSCCEYIERKHPSWNDFQQMDSVYVKNALKKKTIKSLSKAIEFEMFCEQ